MNGICGLMTIRRSMLNTMRRRGKKLRLANIGPLSMIKSWTQWMLFPIYGSDLPIDAFTFSSVYRP